MTTGQITPIGVGSATPRARQTSAGAQLTNLLAQPGNTSVPVIFEPSLQLTSGLPEVWVVATGGKNALIVPGVENNASFIARFLPESFFGVGFRPPGGLARPQLAGRTAGFTPSPVAETDASFVGRFVPEQFRGVGFRPPGTFTRPMFQARGAMDAGVDFIDFQLSTLPGSIEVGNFAEDFEHPAAFPPGTVVTAINGGVVTFSNPVSPLPGDTITFYTTNWGGCQVWISLDGDTYTLGGTIYTGGRTGILTKALPYHVDQDNDNVLSVDLTRSSGQLLSGTVADLNAFVTLCYVGGELIAYQNARLTAAFNYDLTALHRGVYGSVIGSHLAGSLFARFGPNDPALFRYRYPINLVGTEIFIKLPSFNVFGQVMEALDEVPPNSYILTGAGAITPANVPIQFAGTPMSGTPILLFTFGESVTFAGNLAGSACGAVVGATLSAPFNLDKNGVGFGTMTFGAGSAVASFATTGGASVSFVAGDLLAITPTTTDATLANLSGFLAGTAA